jgi:hypothetical protein
MCYNHQVGEAVDDYIKAMAIWIIHTAGQNTTVMKAWNIRAKHKTTKFYNKEHESGHRSAWYLAPRNHADKREGYTKIHGKFATNFVGCITELVAKNCETTLQNSVCWTTQSPIEAQP